MRSGYLLLVSCYSFFYSIRRRELAARTLQTALQDGASSFPPSSSSSSVRLHFFPGRKGGRGGGRGGGGRGGGGTAAPAAKGTTRLCNVVERLQAKVSLSRISLSLPPPSLPPSLPPFLPSFIHRQWLNKRLVMCAHPFLCPPPSLPPSLRFLPPPNTQPSSSGCGRSNGCSSWPNKKSKFKNSKSMN